MFWKTLGRAGRLWWQHWIAILVLNILWFGLQIPIVSGPPATATFFSIGRRIIQGELWDASDLWREWRRFFLASWIWAAFNLVIIGALAFNLTLYWSQIGIGWSALRIFWSLFFAQWLLVNLLYWPFWLAQTEPNLRNSLQNGLLFLLQHPMSSVGTIFLLGVLGTIGAVTVLPIPFGLVGFFVLIGLILVEETLKLRDQLDKSQNL